MDDDKREIFYQKTEGWTMDRNLLLNLLAEIHGDTGQINHYYGVFKSYELAVIKLRELKEAQSQTKLRTNKCAGGCRRG